MRAYSCSGPAERRDDGRGAGEEGSSFGAPFPDDNGLGCQEAPGMELLIVLRARRMDVLLDPYLGGAFQLGGFFEPRTPRIGRAGLPNEPIYALSGPATASMQSNRIKYLLFVPIPDIPFPYTATAQTKATP